MPAQDLAIVLRELGTGAELNRANPRGGWKLAAHIAGPDAELSPRRPPLTARRLTRRDGAPASPALRNAERHGPFERTVDLLGDGSIRLLDTPGHTAGHVSVLVRLAGREALLVGDAVYSMRNLHEGILPWRTVDDDIYRQSVRELRAYAEQNPNALVIPTHDGEVWDRLDDTY
jgi:glyoxylase-like metal-dependent hydrolase (beta-lactamase superfamily II)